MGRMKLALMMLGLWSHIAGAVCLGVWSETGTAYGDDYTNALQRSRHEGRPLLVLIGAEWCGPCKAVKRREAELRRLGVYVYLDCDADRGRARWLLGDRGVPHLIVDRKTRVGWVRYRLHDLREILDWLGRQ